MLERKHLPALLKEDRHLHVLDLTCAQCAPDSADYIRVSVVCMYHTAQLVATVDYSFARLLMSVQSQQATMH